MKLVDAGVIDLDTPIAHYLPGDYVRDPRGAQITPRNALSHTTGFPNWRNNDELKLYTAPGERFSYSGEGVVYLALAVENVTGKTLNVVMKEQVFVPLGMTSSSYTWQERFEKRKAMGHDASGEPSASSGRRARTPRRACRRRSSTTRAFSRRCSTARGSRRRRGRRCCARRSSWTRRA